MCVQTGRCDNLLHFEVTNNDIKKVQRLARYWASRTPARIEYDDLVQEGLLAVWKYRTRISLAPGPGTPGPGTPGRPGLKPEGAGFRAWAAMVEYIRSSKAYSRHRKTAYSEPVSLSSLKADETPMSHNMQPDELLESHQELNQAADLINTRTAEQITLVALRAMGYTHPEISKMTGKPVATVQQQWHMWSHQLRDDWNQIRH